MLSGRDMYRKFRYQPCHPVAGQLLSLTSACTCLLRGWYASNFVLKPRLAQNSIIGHIGELLRLLPTSPSWLKQRSLPREHLWLMARLVERAGFLLNVVPHNQQFLSS